MTYRCRNISTGNALDWCIEVIKCFTLDDLRTDFTADTKGGEATFHNQESRTRI